MNRKEFRDLASPDEAREGDRLALARGRHRARLARGRSRSGARRTTRRRTRRAGVRPGEPRRLRPPGTDTFGADEADPARLELVGEVHAGAKPDVGLEPGQAAEISTGAVMPDGADAMVPVERTDTDADGDEVLIRTAVAPGDNVMFAGADIAAGERALGPGTVITPRDIGLLSALGIDEVPVRAKPRVGIVSTGDELVRPGEKLHSERGEIYDVNSYTIAAGSKMRAARRSSTPRRRRTRGDGADSSERGRRVRPRALLGVDQRQRGRRHLPGHRGARRIAAHGVSVKPGKPMLIGRLEDSAYVGLPGYPVSAMMVFRTFVAPAIRQAAGVPEPASATVSGRLARQERYEEGRHRLMPVGLVTDSAGETLVYPVDKGSGATTSLADADGVVEVGPETDYLEAGEPVTVTLFSPDVRPPTLFGVGEGDPTVARLLDGLDNPAISPSELGPVSGDSASASPTWPWPQGRSSTRGRRRQPPQSARQRARERRDRTGPLGRGGLVVQPGNPDEIEGLEDLIDRDLRFVNRTTDSGLCSSLDAAIASLAEERGADRHEIVDAIDGFDLGLRAHESPARKVIASDADAGLGLRETADRLDLGFVPVGEQPVRVLANPDRMAKDGVRELEAALADVSSAQR